MMAAPILATVLLAFAAEVTAVTAGGVDVTAATQYGSVVGKYSRYDGVNRFFGIPVAATTGAANRFKEPQPPATWALPMTTIESKQCLHVGDSGVVGSEDCLAVDIIAPSNPLDLTGSPTVAAPGSYPVQVVLGGSLDPSLLKDDTYAGPGEKPVVTVRVTHRVGVLGGLSHPALRNGIDGNSYSGNWMLHDVLNALRWVQANIASFGGDPNKVAVHGQGTGATLAGLLLASPLSYSGTYAVSGPLFSSIIMQSPVSLGGPSAFFSQAVRDAAGAETVRIAGCAEDYGSLEASTGTLTSIAECLRFSTTAALLQTSPYLVDVVTFDSNFGDGTAFLLYSHDLAVNPVVDGYALPLPPLDLIEAENGANVNVIIGQTIDDYAPFLDDEPPDLAGAAGVAAYRILYGPLAAYELNHTATIGDLQAASLALPIGTIESYYSSIADPYQQMVAASTDGYYSVNLNNVIDKLVDQDARTAGTVFRYLFADPIQDEAWPAPLEPSPSPADPLPSPEPSPSPSAQPSIARWGVPNMADLTFTWSLYSAGKNVMTDIIPMTAGSVTYTAEQNEMGASMKTYWTNFFYDGVPGTNGITAWAPSTRTERHTIVFQSTVLGGAALDPCAMFTSCMAEPTADFRRSQHSFWTSGLISQPALPTCSPVIVGLSHISPWQFTSNCGVDLPLNSPRPSRTPTLESGLEAGAVVGIAIGSLVVGVVVGIGGALALTKANPSGTKSGQVRVSSA